MNVSTVCESSSAAFAAVHGFASGTVDSKADHLAEQARKVRRVGLGQRRDQPREMRLGAGIVEDLGALGVGLERADAVRPRAGEDVVLTGADPLPADLDHLAVAERMVERPAADSVACLEHDHRVAGVDEIRGGAQAREPGSDNDHIGRPGGSSFGRRRCGCRGGCASGRARECLASREAGHRPALTHPGRVRSSGNGRSATTAVWTYLYGPVPAASAAPI